MIHIVADNNMANRSRVYIIICIIINKGYYSIRYKLVIMASAASSSYIGNGALKLVDVTPNENEQSKIATMAGNRQVISNYVHEQDKFFEPGLAANVNMYKDTYEMQNALHILDEARRPVELSKSRQGRLGALSNSLKMIRPQLVTLSEQQRNVVKDSIHLFRLLRHEN
jgi:hypothetical protein